MFNLQEGFRSGRVQEFLAKLFKSFNTGLYNFDPLYKAGCGQDENSNSDWEEIMAAFDWISMETSASMAATHHFAKGNYIDKDPMDRAAGAGVIAGRAPGVTMIFTPHKESFCYTVDIRAREFAAVPPFVIRRAHPLMVEDPNLDPADLFAPPTKIAVNVKTARKEEKLKAIMAALRIAADAKTGITLTHLQAAVDVPKNTLRDHLKELIKLKKVIFSSSDTNYQLSPSEGTAWQNAPA